MSSHIIPYVIMATIILNSIADKIDFKRNCDKCVLDPVDLIDIVIEERRKSSIPIHRNIFIAHTKASKKRKIASNKSKEKSDDIETLKSRKMWSRWSKWSKCSVTCGEGNTVRQRSCVAGRCAPHESEEQRRPCARPPCSRDNTEDLHDLE